MNDDRNSDPISGNQRALSGALAGIASRIAISPLDVIKIRIQLHASNTRSSPLLPSIASSLGDTKARNDGILGTFRTLVKEEGLRSLWKGTWAGGILYVTYGATQFYTVDLYRQGVATAFSIDNHERNHVAVDFIAGGMAGATATTLTFPFDLLRTRFAAQAVNNKIYTSIISAFADIYKAEGFKGFYRGLTPSLLQVTPLMALLFSTFHLAHNIMSSILPKSLIEKHKSLVDLMSGAVAGVVSKSLVMPLDVMRKRLQVQGPTRSLYSISAIPQYASTYSLWAIGKDIVAREGVRALYKGVAVSVIKSGISSAVTFGAYTTANRFLQSRNSRRVDTK